MFSREVRPDRHLHGLAVALGQRLGRRREPQELVEVELAVLVDVKSFDQLFYIGLGDVLEAPLLEDACELVVVELAAPIICLLYTSPSPRD